MPNKIVLMTAGLVFASGAALADTYGGLITPSTTGNEEMERPAANVEDPERGKRGAMSDRTGNADNEQGLGTMGTGATGTTGGMGATTGTDTIEDRDDTEQ